MPGQVTEFLQTQFEDEIKKFIRNSPYHSDEDISDFANYLRICGYINDLTQESRLTNKFFHKDEKVVIEIDHFLDNFSSPSESDIIDFLNYLQEMGLDFDRSELPVWIEKQKLYRKFNSTEKEGIGESPFADSEDSLVHDIGKPDKKILEDTLSEMGFHHIIRKDKS